MSSKQSDVTLKFKTIVEGKEQLGELSMSAKELEKAMASTMKVAEELKKPIINLAATCTVIDSVSDTLRSLQSAVKDLTGAYAVQREAETKLETVMRQRMGATDEQIASVKSLCSAQQQLGVIGDEVQLQGAQQMATFLKEKSSLDVLIPAMNNLVAQQKGLNATGQDAVNVGNLMGKAMQGQTSALRRVGITFDAAQEEVMKYGTESERAAMLAEIITQNVGEMNAALAQTDAGKSKQTANWLGDIKEQAGALVQMAEPMLSVGASATLAAGGVLKLVQGVGLLFSKVGQLGGALKAFWVSTAVVTSSTGGLAKALGTARLFVSQLATAVAGGTKGLRLFAMAWKGMLVSTGIGIAIVALTSIIAAFAMSADDAADSTDRLTEAQKLEARTAEAVKKAREEEQSAIENGKMALHEHIAVLRTFNGTKEEERKLVSEMNGIYGETMGYQSSVADWYKTLTENSEAYCKQLVIQARLQRIASEIAAIQDENYDLTHDENGNKRKYSTKGGDSKEDIERGYVWVSTGIDENGIEKGYRRKAKKSDKDEAQDKYDANIRKIAALEKEAQAATEDKKGIKFKTEGKPETPDKPTGSRHATTMKPEKIEAFKGGAVTLDAGVDDVVVSTDKVRMTLGYIKSQIAGLGDRLDDVTESEAAGLNRTIALWEKKREAIVNAGKESPKLDDIAAVGDIKSIEGFNGAIQRLRAGLESATDPEGVEAWARKLMKYEKALVNLTLASELPSMEEELNKLTGLKGTDKYIIKVKEMGLDGIKSKIEELDERINNTDDEGLKERLKRLREQWEKLYKEASAAEKVETAVGLISDSLSSLGGALSGSTGEILTWASQALTALHELTNMICAMIPALKAYATAQAVAGAAGSGPLGWLMVGAAAASVIATFASMPKFAEGGVISGPTLGLMGEYAGAVNNPEVVAPLDKLRSLLQPVGGIGAGKVEFEIDGRVLRGVLRKVERLSMRS